MDHPQGDSCNNVELSVVLNKSSPNECFGVAKLSEVLRRLGFRVLLTDHKEATSGEAIRVLRIDPSIDPEIRKEGFRITNSFDAVFITAIEGTGAMYGLLELAEQLEIKRDLNLIESKLMNPRFPFRAVKYNLPWESYRENDALQANLELSRDLTMWEAFLDMMAHSRLNVLTLWSLHPFPYFIRAQNFPRATPFSDEELRDWKRFWTKLFRMAKDRGIDTYLINWNIIVSKNFRQFYGEGNTNLWADGFTSPLIEQYTRESVTQILNEYPDLTGLGVTPGEAMQGWEAEQMANWFERTFFDGIRAAERKSRFIYRAALHGDHQPHRDVIDRSGIGTVEEPVIVELKFNWSHGHSSTSLIRDHGGRTGKEYWSDPPPRHHKMAWMIRNEDFFRLRWGDPDFIREHIGKNGQDFAAGYFIGSECYIPAKDIFTLPGRIHWNYDFERTWLYYMEWGRLLFDPTTEDSIFANAFNQRHQFEGGGLLVEAIKLSSRTAQRILQFFEHTWDHSFYAEGLIGNNRDFISLDEFITHKPIEPEFTRIKDYGLGEQSCHGKINPPELAAEIEKNVRRALNLVSEIEVVNEVLQSEVDDVIAWSHLGFYFARKILAAVAVNQQKGSLAISLMEEAKLHWEALVEVTQNHYQASDLAITETCFHWANYSERVEAEIQLLKDREKNTE